VLLWIYLFIYLLADTSVPIDSLLYGDGLIRLSRPLDFSVEIYWLICYDKFIGRFIFFPADCYVVMDYLIRLLRLTG
jgi:hypothetical protein